MPTSKKTKVMQPVGNKNQLQFVVNHEASKKAVIKRSAIFEETKLKNYESKNAKYIASQRKKVKGWKEPSES